MNQWLDLLLPLSPHYGVLVVFTALFLNNIGLPLPGETVLLGAGFVLGSRAGFFEEPVFAALLAATLAGFLGGVCAFALGRRIHPNPLPDIRWLRRILKRLERIESLFRKPGAVTVLVARFIPVLPPFAVNLLAGKAHLPWTSFLWFNLPGSAGFSALYLALGCYLGASWLSLRAVIGRMLA